MKKFLSMLVLCGMLSGCYASRFPITQRNVPSEPTQSETKLFFAWGLIPQPQYTDPAQICGGLNNVGLVETKTTFIDGLIGALTFGIVAPQTANVYCTNYGYQPQYQQQGATYPNQGYYQQPQTSPNYQYGSSYYQKRY